MSGNATKPEDTLKASGLPPVGSVAERFDASRLGNGAGRGLASRIEITEAVERLERCNRSGGARHSASWA